jgi:hypothetical protein
VTNSSQREFKGREGKSHLIHLAFVLALIKIEASLSLFLSLSLGEKNKR